MGIVPPATVQAVAAPWAGLATGRMRGDPIRLCSVREPMIIIQIIIGTTALLNDTWI